ncbi:hypothetical protein HanXRQr2_Chr03g0118271 [Helianthus annuus]|uniref:Uncharacterized protein n=1 Tax=Helianthus annuus TaxID=4232 RepID=A0A9K3JH50_HELAN|nr:hypothetical protein HanXRQr2_Chr03g0118271 [Helianthus annuus]KAJ0944294.1 hypothetical protein HanPSC8_Chr03g0114901 [Helianthus annuus]
MMKAPVHDHTWLLQEPCSQPRTSAIPVNDSRNGVPAFAAWIASSR